MSLTTPQISWLDEFADIQEELATNSQQEDAKFEAIESVREQIDPIRKEIQAMLKFTVAKNGKELFTLLSDSHRKWQVEEELDTVHDAQLDKSVPPEIIKRAQRAFDKLHSLSTELESAGLNEKEVREAFWKPLVREGICPDNFVPNRFNETVQVYQGADKYYQARLIKENPDGRVEGVRLAKFLTDKAATISKAVVEAAGGPAIISEAIGAANLLAQATLQVVEGVLVKDSAGIVDAIGAAMQAGFKVTPVPPEIAAAITGSFVATAKTGEALSKLCADPPDPEQAVRLLGNALGGAVNGALGVSISGAVVSTKTGENVNPGRIISEVFCAAADLKGLTRCIQEKDVQGAIGIMKGMTSRVMADASVKGSLDDAFDGLAKGAKAYEEMKARVTAQEQEATKAEIEKALSEENWEEELNAALEVASIDPDLRDELTEDKKKMNSIEKMIIKIETARAALKFAECVFDSGMKTAAEFFEPLKMATGGKDFVKHMIISVERAIQINQWIDKVEKAELASSVYGAAFANRVKNLKIQISEHTLHALLDLCQVAAGALSVAGAAGYGAGAVAGVIVGKAATAAQAAADVSFELAKQADAALQWKKYRKCLDMGERTDRKLMREVLRGNPTLSKYAMAYGAIIEGDAVAKRGMKLCGLSEENLTEDRVDVELVVKYLESKFDEDPKLIKRLPSKSFDQGEDLNLKTIRASLKQAHKDTKFIYENLEAVEGAIAEFEQSTIYYDGHNLLLRDLHRDYAPVRKSFDEFEAAYLLSKTDYDEITKVYKAERSEYRTRRDKANKDRATHGDAQFIADYLDAMNAVLTNLVVRREAAEDTITKMGGYREYAGKIQTSLAEYLEQLTGFQSKQKEYFAACDRLVRALNAVKPMREGDNGREADRDVKEYLANLAIKVERAKADALAEHPDVEGEISRLASEQKQVTGGLDKQLDEVKKDLEQKLTKRLPEMEKTVSERAKRWKKRQDKAKKQEPLEPEEEQEPNDPPDDEND